MATNSLSPRTDLTQEYVLSRLKYDRWTGFFEWLPREEQSFTDRRWNRQFAGSRAGTINGVGYVYISLGGSRYAAHRLAWLIENGLWPEADLDHKDRDRSNNAIGNLRVASDAENQANVHMWSSNTSGVKGVCWHKSNRVWTAGMRHNGKRVHLGSFQTKEEAARAYADAYLRLLGDFAYPA